jgi:hypothetical protein
VGAEAASGNRSRNACVNVSEAASRNRNRRHVSACECSLGEAIMTVDMDDKIICEFCQYCRLLRDKEGTSLEFLKHRIDVLDDSLDAGNDNPSSIRR